MSACALSSVVHLIGWMYLLAIPLSSLSVIPLLLAVGLCIDYCMHVAHEFWEESGPPIDRALAALSARGVAVTNGGVSTGISVSLLAFSGTAIMTTYFKMLVGVVVVGLWHALVLLPVALVALGTAEYPHPPATRQLAERNGKTKEHPGRSSTPQPLLRSAPPARLPTPTRMPTPAGVPTPPASPYCQRTSGTELPVSQIHPAIARSRASKGSPHHTPPAHRPAAPSSLPQLGQLSGVGRGSSLGMAGRLSTGSCDGAMEADVVMLREQMDHMAAQLQAAQARISSAAKATPESRSHEGAEDGELGV
jgi:hypothetical protein